MAFDKRAPTEEIEIEIEESNVEVDENGNSKAEIESEYSNITRNNFPGGFVFGTATSAYQHEGGAAKDGRGLSVWDAFTLRTPKRIRDGSNGNKAVDMYNRYKEDIKMMKSLGFDAYRFSISWSRVLPGGKLSLGVNREGISFYNELIKTLKRNEIEPYVTLFHWDLPYTLEQEYGGFLSENIVNDFRDFAQLCFWEFGDRVKYWVTFNDPWTYCVRGYVDRKFPPGKTPGNSDEGARILKKMKVDSDLVDKVHRQYISERVADRTGNNFIPYRGLKEEDTDLNFITYCDLEDKFISEPTEKNLLRNKTLSVFTELNSLDFTEHQRNLAKEAYIAAKNMLRAHAEAVDLYREKFKHQKGEIGITLVSHWFEAHTNVDKDEEAAKRALDFMLGWFLEPVLTGNYPESMKTFIPREASLAGYSNSFKGSIDFLGLNYYTTLCASDDPEPSVLTGYYKDMKVQFHSENSDGNMEGGSSCAPWLHVFPRGIYNLLNHIHEKYNKTENNLPPIYITENGFADPRDDKRSANEVCQDKERENYYREHLGNVLDAINKGVNVRGYFAWSWCDNFEWVDGYKYRSGIIYVDYVDHLKRYPKGSALWFAKFLEKTKGEEEKQNQQNQNQDQHNKDQNQNGIKESV